MRKVDVLIIGGGPAGLTAGIYIARGGKSSIILEKSMPGGQVLYTFEVQNYPSYSNIGGMELMENFKKHYIDMGGEIVISNVSNIVKQEGGFLVDSTSGTILANRIILSMGASPRKLGAYNEEKYIGRGVSYCATCDGGFFVGKDVIVVGGGDTAFEEIIYLSNIARSIVSIHRSETYKANQNLIDRVQVLVDSGKVRLIKAANITHIDGEISVKRVTLDNGETIPTDAVFVAIGRRPDSDIVADMVDMKDGYIITDECMRTSQSGIYAAGDIIKKSLRQIVTASNDGAIAGSYSITD